MAIHLHSLSHAPPTPPPPPPSPNQKTLLPSLGIFAFVPHHHCLPLSWKMWVMCTQTDTGAHTFITHSCTHTHTHTCRQAHTHTHHTPAPHPHPPHTHHRNFNALMHACRPYQSASSITTWWRSQRTTSNFCANRTWRGTRRPFRSHRFVHVHFSIPCACYS